MFSRRGGPACPPARKALHGTIERQRLQEQRPFDFPPRFSAPPDTRRKAGEKERSSASRQKTDGSRRHRFGRPPSARRATAPERGKKAAFSFGPCNRAAVGGSAALRWTAVRGFAALRMSRPPCGEMRHTPCGYGPFSFCQEQKENGGWNDPAIIMAGFPVQWDALGASPRGNGPRRPPVLKTCLI